MFVIEDELHAEPQEGEYASPIAPCTNWRTCGRAYEIVEYDTSSIPWKELRRVPVLEIDSSGANWVKPGERQVT